jgi:hypothetical protein
MCNERNTYLPSDVGVEANRVIKVGRLRQDDEGVFAPFHSFSPGVLDKDPGGPILVVGSERGRLPPISGKYQ